MSEPKPNGGASPEIEFLCTDAAEVLASGPSGRFNGFTLSNIVDAAPPGYRKRLLTAVQHAAAPGPSWCCGASASRAMPKQPSGQRATDPRSGARSR